MSGDPMRNLKDFLLQYNRISESCFSRCINTFGQREMSFDEINCSETCVQKHMKLNMKIMQVYVEVQPQIVQKRIDEMNKASTGSQETPPNTTTATTEETDKVAVTSSAVQI